MRRWIAPSVLLLAAAVMLALSWRKWPDPLVDFGRELYVPWRITRGDVLYRDLAYFNGPLSPYFNALVFSVFGVGMMQLAAANLLVFAGIVTMMHHLLLRAGDGLTALLGSMVLVSMFGFLQLVEIGNYNYVTPYSHELTHGMLLSLSAIHLALWNARASAPLRSGAIGLVLGLLFLTKVEMFIAGAAATLAVTLATTLSACRQRQFAESRTAALCLPAGFLLPVGSAVLLLGLAMPPTDALRGVLGAWKYLGSAEITAMPFYQRVAGFDDIRGNIGTAAMRSAGYAVLAVAIWIISRITPQRMQVLAGALGAIVLAAAAYLFFDRVPWQTLFRGAPVPLLLALGWLLWRLRSSVPEGVHDERFLARLALCVLACALILKIALNVTVQHYGFVLAMPAVMVLVWLYAHCLPLAAGAPGRPSVCARMLAAAVIGVVSAVHIHVARSIYYQAKTVPIGQGADRFLAGRRGAAVARVIEQLHADAPPGATLACIPEGVMVNYLTRRLNPTPYFTLMPLEMRLFGPDRILSAYRARPPDYILIVPHDTAEWGVRGFAQDYGRELAEWIASDYTDITRDPDRQFPISLLRRRH